MTKEITKNVVAKSNMEEIKAKVAEFSEAIKKANSLMQELAEMELKVEFEIE